MVLRLFVLLLVGCSRVTPAIAPLVVPPARSAPVVQVDLASMFVLPTPAPVETRCKPFPLPRAPPESGVIYDFADMPLGAVERGPRTSTRERRAERMTTAELHRPFARRANHITRCWKWFAATHPGNATQLDLHLAIDVFGATHEIRIVNRPEDADLAACIRDAFAAPLYLYPARQREQTTTVTLHFERADQPAWTTLPSRPPPLTNEPLPERGTTCVRVVAKPIAARMSPLLVTDFDPSRTPPPPKQRGMRVRVAAIPMLRVGCMYVANLPKKRELRGAVQSNWGAYEACHAAARARMPGLTGKVVVKLRFDAGGAEPTLAAVSGDGDAEFHACLDLALEQIWLQPPTDDRVVEANFVFPLVTDPPLPSRDVASWQTTFANAATAIDGCRARHELVIDRMAAAPWVDDARVRAAFAELVRYVGSLAPSEAAACIAEVATTLQDYTGIDESSRTTHAQQREAHLDRLETVLGIAHLVPWGPQLRQVVALAYRKDPTRFADGTRMLQELVLDPKNNDVVRLDDTPIPIENTCAI